MVVCEGIIFSGTVKFDNGNVGLDAICDVVENVFWDGHVSCSLCFDKY